jgi:hypothetical protein
MELIAVESFHGELAVPFEELLLVMDVMAAMMAMTIVVVRGGGSRVV